MSRNHPSPRSPNAPSSDVTIDAVAFALLPPPSPLSPASPQRSGATNLFQECSEKQASDIASTGYSPAKKKGGRRIRGAGISPRDADLIAEAFPSDEDDDDYVPTQTVACHRLRRREGEEMPRLFSTVMFLLISTRRLSIRTCSSADILPFTPRTKWSNSMLTIRSNYPSIFCATRATRKKAADIFWRTSCPIRLVVASLFAYERALPEIQQKHLIPIRRFISSSSGNVTTKRVRCFVSSRTQNTPTMSSANSLDISVCEEKGVEVEPIWTDYLNELRPNYYN